jgi:hypothetical protein
MLNITIDKEMIRIGERFGVSFQRTLRIPDDNRVYPLPPGLGRLPVLKVGDYLDRVPPPWREQGGAFIPMYQREALWLGFHAASWKPNAVKIAIGRVNAISGEPYDVAFHSDPQDYIVCPDQPWLDGIHTGRGSVRQFVAMPLGLSYTIEASMTGVETFGGIQITVFEPKPGRFPDEPPAKPDTAPVRTVMPKPGGITAMGLGAGGVMKQKIYSDPYGIDVWDPDNYGQVFVYIINSAEFFEITGIKPPPTPINAKTYTEYGLPWFDLYDEAKGDIAPSEVLSMVKTISARDAERGEVAQTDTSFEVPESQIKRLGNDNSRAKDRQSSMPDSAGYSPKGE